MKSQRAVQRATVRLRPADLAREHGLSTQAVRNYESDGLLPPADRTAAGYRVYTGRHRVALSTFLALVPAHGYLVSRTVMRAVNSGELDTAMRAIDESHAQLLRDRDTVGAVTEAIGALTVPRPDSSLRRGSSWTVGEVARRLRLSPATLRKWERAGLLVPVRERSTGYRRYGVDDVRDAELAHLLRRGGYPLPHIATVLAQVREAGGAEPLAASLAAWRRRLTDRSRAMLAAAGHLDRYLQLPAEPASGADERAAGQEPGSADVGHPAGPPL